MDRPLPFLKVWDAKRTSATDFFCGTRSRRNRSLARRAALCERDRIDQRSLPHWLASLRIGVEPVPETPVLLAHAYLGAAVIGFARRAFYNSRRGSHRGGHCRSSKHCLCNCAGPLVWSAACRPPCARHPVGTLLPARAFSRRLVGRADRAGGFILPPVLSPKCCRPDAAPAYAGVPGCAFLLFVLASFAEAGKIAFWRFASFGKMALK